MWTFSDTYLAIKQVGWSVDEPLSAILQNQSIQFSANTTHMWTNLNLIEPWLQNNHNKMIHSHTKYLTDE